MNKNKGRKLIDLPYGEMKEAKREVARLAKFVGEKVSEIADEYEIDRDLLQITLSNVLSRRVEELSLYATAEEKSQFIKAAESERVKIEGTMEKLERLIKALESFEDSDFED